jgi:hypothetical protein
MSLSLPECIPCAKSVILSSKVPVSSMHAELCKDLFSNNPYSFCFLGKERNGIIGSAQSGVDFYLESTSSVDNIIEL